MATTNRYGKRLVLVDELMELGYEVTSRMSGKRKKTYLIKSRTALYRLEFDKDWLAINQDKDRLFCGINLSNGKRLSKCMDSDLTKLFNDVTTILYNRTDIKIPQIIL
jgi:hypothetical protein